MLGTILGLVAGGGLIWWYAEHTGDDNSAEGIDTEVLTGPAATETAGQLADAIGWPYFWNRGTPATPWSDGPRGVDCSGFAQMALVRLGLLSSSAPDRSSSALAYACDPVDVCEQVPGDLAYYPGHVAVVIGDPDLDGHSAVMCATGHKGTEGNVPGEEVKVYATARYRSDFVTYMRLKPENRA